MVVERRLGCASPDPPPLAHAEVAQAADPLVVRCRNRLGPAHVAIVAVTVVAVVG
jgi:hypothetical protein